MRCKILFEIVYDDFSISVPAARRLASIQPNRSFRSRVRAHISVFGFRTRF